jgi:lactate dehydrogenase-like 2-hydroxyacid dehydrogenase
VIRANGAVSRAVIKAARKRKVIGRYRVGLDGIDLTAAKERKIPVVYKPITDEQLRAIEAGPVKTAQAISNHILGNFALSIGAARSDPQRA